MKLKVFLFVLLVQMVTLTAVQSQTLHFSVAASMTDAFKEILTAYASEHTEVELRPNFASSGSLAKQIEQGAPADFYISANPKWMKYLVEKNLIAKGTDRVFAYNSLVFIGEENANISSLEDLAVLERIALGSPNTVPAGQYAKQAMEKSTLYATLEKGKKLVLAKDVRQALMYADRGEVDGAFVYKTDAILARNAKILFTVPQQLYKRVSYPLGLTLTGSEKEAAKLFVEYMRSPESLAILTKYGFEPAR